MKRNFSILAFTAAPLCSIGQTALNNSGGSIYIGTAGQVYVSGDISNGSGSILNNNGMLTVTGMLSNNAAMASPASGTLRFNGSGAQTLGGTADYFAKDVVVNNAAGVTLNTRLRVDGVMSFNTGILDASNASYPVVFTANAAVSSANAPADASHIKGYAVKEGTGPFTYPVGDGNRYQPVAVDLSANSSGLTARYYAADAGNAAFGTGGASPVQLLYYNTREYWELTPAGSATGSVTVFWDGFNNPGIGDPADLRVAHKSGGAWLNEGAASVSGTTGAGSATSNQVSTWSPFTVGSISATSPLPIQLVSVTAEALPQTNRIGWQTVGEQDITAFEIERSEDGRTFTPIGRQLPGGSGAYSFSDVRPPNGTAYYRLHVLESNHSSYSQLVRVARGNDGRLTFNLCPNPVAETVTVQASEPGTLFIKDMTGRIRSQTEISGNAAVSLKDLPPGAYLAVYQSAAGSETVHLNKR